MVEQQVEVVVLGIDQHPLLPLQKGKADAEFQDKTLHLAQDRRLHVLLGIGVVQPKEIRDVGIAEDEIGRQLVLAA